jgi:hydrogenase nickel incorporation protein HypB
MRTATTIMTTTTTTTTTSIHHHPTHQQPGPQGGEHQPTLSQQAGGAALHYGQGAHAHAPGLSQARMVKIEQDILSKNDGYAAQNRQWLRDRGIFALNLVSSPGSGKTTLLAETIRQLGSDTLVYVVEGDQQTSNDAERIRAAGAPAIQINTGKGCHLDAHMVGQALEQLNPADDSLLLIENVGNLVCPAAFDLGEAHKVAILSVTEGEDKPLKYPDMFAAADIMLLTKIDLLRHLISTWTCALPTPAASTRKSRYCSCPARAATAWTCGLTGCCWK